MTKTIIFPIQVHFGDCDPAGIVFFPNFSRWMDAASLHFFRECGVPAWNQIKEPSGFVGTPLLEVHSRFLKTATYTDNLLIHTTILEWHTKVFVQHHVIMHDDSIICEARETRAFCARNTGGQLKAVPIPSWIRLLCE